jgi:flagellar protein FlaF
MSHKRAVNSYEQMRTRGGNPRETEGRALLEAAHRMSAAQKVVDNPEALRRAARLNWRLWTIFQAEISRPDSTMPAEMRTNMLNLCNFIDKRMVDILADPKPEMLDVLININRQIAAGLLTSPSTPTGSGADDGSGTPGTGSGVLSI